jgi:hypothetical protein
MRTFNRRNERKNLCRIILCANDAPAGSSANGMPVPAVVRAYELRADKPFYLFPFISPIYSIALRDISNELQFAYVASVMESDDEPSGLRWFNASKLISLFTHYTCRTLTERETSYRVSQPRGIRAISGQAMSTRQNEIKDNIPPLTATDESFETWSPFPHENVNSVLVTTEFKIAAADINSHFRTLREYRYTSPGIIDAAIVQMTSLHIRRQCPVDSKHLLPECIAFHISAFISRLSAIAKGRTSLSYKPHLNPTAIIRACVDRAADLSIAHRSELEIRGC